MHDHLVADREPRDDLAVAVESRDAELHRLERDAAVAYAPDAVFAGDALHRRRGHGARRRAFRDVNGHLGEIAYGQRLRTSRESDVDDALFGDGVADPIHALYGAGMDTIGFGAQHDGDALSHLDARGLSLVDARPDPQGWRGR